MNKILKSFAIASVALVSVTSCIQEIEPQTSTVTEDQAANAPGSFDGFVSGITGSLVGQFTYAGSNNYPYDFGYPSFFLFRDVMGNDMALEDSGSEWYSGWYGGSGLGPTTGRAQMPWTYYYGWIKNCNTVLSLAKGHLDASDASNANFITGAGIAHCMRAMFYMDLAQMFAPQSYAANPDAPTVPKVTETTALSEATENPRLSNKDMYEFILSDLESAEKELQGYERSDVYTPDVTVVYGLKARLYLLMEDWQKAKEYAQKAMAKYTMMSEQEYLSQTDGFNKPNSSWMFGTTFKSTDPNITANDADSNWGSQMIIEVSASGCGYSANYVGPKRIDAHLYSTIPATDFRRKCWIDPAIDELETEEAVYEALKVYTDDPEGVANTGWTVSSRGTVGCMPVKFRPKDGEHADQYKAFTVAVPFMRVEEMKLIEAEAAGMINESDGINLLTQFAKTRDANYEYGTHTDSYGNGSTGKFRNEIWWQRRVELWGEGFAMYDIKRLNKGVIRSYAGTNHPSTYAWNIGDYQSYPGTNYPDWMNYCIVQTETNYNSACTNNSTPVPPTSTSSEYTW